MESARQKTWSKVLTVLFTSHQILWLQNAIVSQISVHEKCIKSPVSNTVLKTARGRETAQVAFILNIKHSKKINIWVMTMQQCGANKIFLEQTWLEANMSRAWSRLCGGKESVWWWWCFPLVIPPWLENPICISEFHTARSFENSSSLVLICIQISHRIPAASRSRAAVIVISRLL